MSLDDELLQAHADGDHLALVTLYQKAAEAAESSRMAAFYLTHAHIFALETGHPQTEALRQRLVDQGREDPLPPPRPPLR